MTNFVLVHGSFQGGWIWQPVAKRLRALGHVVYTPTLQGCGERKHQIGPGITVTTQATELAELIVGGLKWLCNRQNDDGGWGDTDRSKSNIATIILPGKD